MREKSSITAIKQPLTVVHNTYLKVTGSDMFTGNIVFFLFYLDQLRAPKPKRIAMRHHKKTRSCMILNNLINNE